MEEEVVETVEEKKKVPPPVAEKKKAPSSVAPKKRPPPVSPRTQKKEIPAHTSAPSPILAFEDTDSAAPSRQESTTEDDLAFLLCDLEETPVTPKKGGAEDGGAGMVTPPAGVDPTRDGRESVRKRRDKRLDRLEQMNWDIDEADEA